MVLLLQALGPSEWGKRKTPVVEPPHIPATLTPPSQATLPVGPHALPLQRACLWLHFPQDWPTVPHLQIANGLLWGTRFDSSYLALGDQLEYNQVFKWFHFIWSNVLLKTLHNKNIHFSRLIFPLDLCMCVLLVLTYLRLLSCISTLVLSFLFSTLSLIPYRLSFLDYSMAYCGRSFVCFIIFYHM